VNLRRSYDELMKNLGRSYENLKKFRKSGPSFRRRNGNVFVPLADDSISTYHASSPVHLPGGLYGCLSFGVELSVRLHERRVCRQEHVVQTASEVVVFLGIELMHTSQRVGFLLLCAMNLHRHWHYVAA